jgi:hypothetical protein
MSVRRRGLVIGLLALALAIPVFLGSLAQVGLIPDAAWAKSSVRPPESAVGNATPNVRPPADQPTDTPSQPGVPRPPDAQPPFAADSERLTAPLAPLGPNSDSTPRQRHGSWNRTSSESRSSGYQWVRPMGIRCCSENVRVRACITWRE